MKVLILLSVVAGAFAFLDCSANQHYESCGTACPLTCDNYNDPPRPCVAMCNPGCHCDKGYVKTEGGECVLPENCPNRANEVCGENERFLGCGTACPLTCDNYQNPPKFCTLQCVIGCACERGYVKTSDGRCVLPENCPSRTNEVCGQNQRYNDCGTACPLTCKNYRNPPNFCTANCVIGCECEKGYVKSYDGRCVLPFNCPVNLEEKSCSAEPDGGMCRGYFPMFHYDAQSGTCKEFIYGGCQGNGNRYASEEECLEHCGALSASGNSVCEQEKVVGPCRAGFRRYFFNKQTGQCEKFIYGGCQGNENNFVSKDKCESTCVV